MLIRVIRPRQIPPGWPHVGEKARFLPADGARFRVGAGKHIVVGCVWIQVFGVGVRPHQHGEWGKSRKNAGTCHSQSEGIPRVYFSPAKLPFAPSTLISDLIQFLSQDSDISNLTKRLRSHDEQPLALHCFARRLVT